MRVRPCRFNPRPDPARFGGNSGYFACFCLEQMKPNCQDWMVGAVIPVIEISNKCDGGDRIDDKSD
jgi:hypothetical protein